MKAQGTDGVSRGSLKEGVCLGNAMLAFCPWGKTPIDRSPQLLDWVKDWLGQQAELLTPEGWYRRGHDHNGGYVDAAGYWRVKIKPGTFIWNLAPVAADAAIEELRKARTKRRQSLHVLLIPRMFLPLWLKQLHKACDLIIYIPPLFNFWNHLMNEPLCIGFCFPFLKHRPWQLRRTPKLLAVAREVHQMCKKDKMDPRSLLRKLVRLARRFPTLQDDDVRKMLYFGKPPELPHHEGGVSGRK